MTAKDDYVEQLGAKLIDDSGNIQVLTEDTNVLFVKQKSDVLRKIINQAMAVASSHYQNRVATSGIDFTEREIQEISLKVVLHNLYVYNMWKNDYPKYHDLELKVTVEDLKHPQSEDQCYFYCKKKYGADYSSYTAALNGQTREQFESWERGRIAFWDR